MSAKCRELTAEEADSLFFPGTGGRPTKAKYYCDTCPMLSVCLEDAIKNNAHGFIAGTTEKERRGMGRFLQAVEDRYSYSIPEPVALIPVVVVEEVHWLDTYEPDDKDIFRLERFLSI